MTGNFSQDFCDRCVRETSAANGELGLPQQQNYQHGNLQHGHYQQQGYQQQQQQQHMQMGFPLQTPISSYGPTYPQNGRLQPGFDHTYMRATDFNMAQRQGIPNGHPQWPTGQEYGQGLLNVRPSVSSTNINTESSRPYSANPPSAIPQGYLDHNSEYERMTRSDPGPRRISPANGPYTLNPGPPRQCKGLGCELFGGVEYNGYCSNCFLEITKHEAVNMNSKLQL